MPLVNATPRRRARTAVGWAVLVSLYAIAALGQEAAVNDPQSTPTLREVIVTAQKRAQPLEKVPIAVSALSGDQLAARGITSPADLLGAIPNLSVVTNDGILYMSLRGVFSGDSLPGADSSVAFYLNGIYLATHEDTGASFYDVSRVEVLKGPQSALYGLNALGGAISVITSRPTKDFYASSEVSAGNYNSLSTREVLSGPLSKTVGARLAVATDNDSGYSLNLFNDRRYDNQNTQSARLTVTFDPTDTLSFTTIGDYHREHDGDYAMHLGGLINPSVPLLGVQLGGASIPLAPNGQAINPRLLDDYVPPTNRRKSWGISEEMKWDLSDSVTVKSLTAYRHFVGFYGVNFTGATWPFPSDVPGYQYAQPNQTHQFSEELQLSGKTEKTDWLMGLFFLNDVVNGGYSLGLNPAPTPFPFTVGGDIRRNAYAAFGQGTYHITDRLGATVGLRYSLQNNHADLAWTSAGALLNGGEGFAVCLTLPDQLCHFVGSHRDSSVSPRFDLHYQWTDDAMTYASASNGFKSGGFEIGSLAPPFRPATVWTYEIGTKLQGSTRRWRANIALFHSDYTDMQVQEATPAGVTEIVNAAKSKMDGLEAEVAARPIAPLEITESFAYLNARYTDYSELNANYPIYGPPGIENLSGNQLQYNSKFTNNVLVSYSIPLRLGALSLSGEWNWRSKQYFSEYNDPLEEQPAYSLYNAFIRYTGSDSRWYVEAYGKNLSNALIISQQSISGWGLNSQYLPPRLYGVTVSYQYGSDK